MRLTRPTDASRIALISGGMLVMLRIACHRPPLAFLNNQYYIKFAPNRSTPNAPGLRAARAMDCEISLRLV